MIDSRVYPRIAARVRMLPAMLVLGAALLARLLAPSALCQPSKEYDLKAVFLFNFAQFVDWPPAVFASAQAPLTIGVLGDDPFGKSLDDVVRNETVKSRKLVVVRFRRLEEVRSCQILFISQSELLQLDRILRTLQGRSILTVGDAEDFASRGGAIGFVADKTRLRLKINTESTKAAGLVVSSKLLRAAEVVNSARPR